VRLIGAVVMALAGVSLFGAMPFAVAAPVDCGPGSVWDEGEGRCVISVSVPSEPGSPGSSGQPATLASGGGKSVPAEPTCVDSLDGSEVPCTKDGGWHWVQGWNTYARVQDPQPEKSDAVWEGNTDGAIYEIGQLVGSGFGLGVGPSIPRWSAAPPWLEVPDPRVLAQQAVEAMDLQAITIGIIPEDIPGSAGLLGLPTWMWAQTPTDNTTGPITRSASAGGYTVTATGRVEEVAWDMGDGTTVTCAGPGQPYEDVYMDSDSPSCGHRYQQQGDHAVTATSYWSVDWSGMGQSGTIALQLQESTTITMGEAQVLNTDP